MSREPMLPMLLHGSTGPEHVVVATINEATVIVIGRDGVHARTTLTEIFRCVDRDLKFTP